LDNSYMAKHSIASFFVEPFTQTNTTVRASEIIEKVCHK
jgi:hypothetical protein